MNARKPGSSAAERGLIGWFRRRLEALCGPIEDSEERVRAVVLVGALLAIVTCGTVFIVTFELIGRRQPSMPGVVVGVAACGFLLWLACKTRRHRLVAIWLGLFLQITFFLVSLEIGTVTAGSGSWLVATPLLMAFLVSTRWAYVFAALAVLQLFMLKIVVYGWFGLAPAPRYAPMTWATAVGTSMAVVFMAYIASLFERSVQRYRGAEQRALERVREANAKLEALFEGTDDAVGLIDREGRFVSLNGAGHTLIEEVCGEGEALPDVFVVANAVGGAREVARWRSNLERVFHGEAVSFELPFGQERARHLDIHLHPAYIEAQVRWAAVYARDITARVEQARKFEELHQQLVSASRLAGMAEVASGVLHNIGNVLNSANVSANALQECASPLVIHKLRKVIDLLASQEDLGAFLASDRGAHVLPYLSAVADQLAEQNDGVRAELDRLAKLLEHMSAVIGAQQRYAKGGTGAREPVRIRDMFDTVAELTAASFGRHGIELTVEVDEELTVVVDRHRALQIVVNLVENAKDAVRGVAGERAPKVAVRARQADRRVRIEVEDNGCGIAPDDLERIFQHGFTTKPDGHGFGLHSAANTAAELGGSLRAESDGPGCGARFILELPLDAAARQEGEGSGAHARAA